MCEIGAQLQHPVPPLLQCDAHTPPTINSDGAQRIILRELYHQLNKDIIHRIGSNHFPRCGASFHLQQNTDVLFDFAILDK